MLDTGFEVFLWVGKSADTHLKSSAFPYAQKYLKSYKRPPVLPIHQHKEGREPHELSSKFGPEKKESCCVIS